MGFHGLGRYISRDDARALSAKPTFVRQLERNDLMYRLAVIAAATLGVAGFSSRPAQADWWINLGETTIAGDATVHPLVVMNFVTSATNEVTITISNFAADPTLFIKRVVFNIKDAFFGAGDVPLFNGTQVGAGPPTVEGIQIAKDSKFIEVNPEKFFDIELDYQDGLGPGQAFTTGLTSTLKFTGTGLTAESFQDVNLGGEPAFFGGIHFGYGGNLSAKTGGTTLHFDPPPGGPEGVPLPSSVYGLLLAAAGLMTFRRTLAIV
jgi:hypothetical protein